jgi:hypothetical protein
MQKFSACDCFLGNRLCFLFILCILDLYYLKLEWKLKLVCTRLEITETCGLSVLINKISHREELYVPGSLLFLVLGIELRSSSMISTCPSIVLHPALKFFFVEVLGMLCLAQQLIFSGGMYYDYIL